MISGSGAASSLDDAASKGGTPAANEMAEVGQIRGFLRASVGFVLVGILVYVALYAIADQLVYQHTVRNRFFLVKTASPSPYDFVILGASHAAALGYDDMTSRLEQMTGARIVNLSNVGGGITINRILLDYFLAEHQTRNVIYVVDSFVFYESQWNEDRLDDVQLINRAPFDPVLVRILLSRPESRPMGLSYLSGFSKINNPDRFSSDISQDDAVNFETTYRPNAQIDQLRIQYLYPSRIDPAVFQKYLAQFDDLIHTAQAHGAHVTVIKPPIPTRFYKMLPGEAQFDQTLQGLLTRDGVAFHDYSLVSNDEQYFFNPDHLNHAGVQNFFDHYFAPLLKQTLAGET